MGLLRFLGRWLRRLLGGLVIVLIALIGGVLAYQHWGMPVVSGTLSLSGLKAPVKVSRDELGVPHIQANDLTDGYFAVGVVHAQDRLWQLQMHKRIAAGRLSEAVGPPALETDRFLRTLGARFTAEKIWLDLDEPTKKYLTAYSAGINQYIDSIAATPWKLSPEFFILNVRPERWDPIDSIAWQIMMAWDLSGNLNAELLRLELTGKIAPKRLAQLMDADVAMGDYAALYKELGLTGTAAILSQLLPNGVQEGVGSNNWVLNGTRTVSGKPLLANDPHLALNAPGLWYLTHVSTPGSEVVGATMPGLPYIVLGRNEKIAWGLTNVEPDSQDLVLEKIDAQDPNRYISSTGPLPFEIRNETILVKGAAAVPLVVRTTRNGPVISDVFPAAVSALKSGVVSKDLVISLRWTALMAGDKTINAGFALNAAQNWLQFTQALEASSAPQQSIVFADVDGNVGYFAPGRIPIRKPENTVKGMLPVPGWDARFDWAGFIPYNELPRHFIAANGQVTSNVGTIDTLALPGIFATANQKIVGPEYAHFIASDWALAYRQKRILSLLSSNTKADVGFMKSMQYDAKSGAVAELIPRMLALAGPSAAGTVEHADVLKALAGWDFIMRGDSALPVIADAWINRFRQLTFSDETGDALYGALDKRRLRHQLLVHVVTKDPTWCDRIDTTPTETCNDLVQQSLREALVSLKFRHGNDWKQWRWNQVHAAVFDHRPFGQHPVLSKLFNVVVPIGGDATAVLATRQDNQHKIDPEKTRHSAGLRAVYDLADADKSQFIIGVGQSGHVLSPHYRDFAARWGSADYVTIPMSAAAVAATSNRVLTLAPQN